jgi:hypothetical protein
MAVEEIKNKLKMYDEHVENQKQLDSLFKDLESLNRRIDNINDDRQKTLQDIILKNHLTYDELMKIKQFKPEFYKSLNIDPKIFIKESLYSENFRKVYLEILQNMYRYYAILSESPFNERTQRKDIELELIQALEKTMYLTL